MGEAIKNFEIKFFWFIFVCGIFLLLFCTDMFSGKKGEDIIVILALLFLIFVFGSMVVDFFLVMKYGMHNIRTGGDILFEEIDKYKGCWGGGSGNYIRQIKIINLYYQKNGKVDELVTNQEFERLFARESFLSMRLSIQGDMTVCLQSLVISIVASFLFAFIKGQSILGSTFGTFIAVMGFFCAIMYKYAERQKDDSYIDSIDAYEKELLLEKIRQAERNLAIVKEDELALETTQIVYDAMIDIRKKLSRKIGKKAKKKVEADIKCIGELNLCVSQNADFYRQKIYINQNPVYLIYNREKGKANNYIGEKNLINSEYKKLYEILEKYNLISYVDE